MNRKGSSLIEVLISLGISLVLMASVGLILTAQMKESKNITQRLAISDLNSLLINTLMNGAVCTRVLTAGSVTFDSTNADSYISLTGIPYSASVGSVDAVSAGTTIQGGVRVESIRLENFANTGTDTYSADFVIRFDANSLVRSAKPIRLSQIIVTNPGSPASAKIPVSCTNPSLPPPPSGYTVVGGCTTNNAPYRPLWGTPTSWGEATPSGSSGCFVPGGSCRRVGLDYSYNEWDRVYWLCFRN